MHGNVNVNIYGALLYEMWNIRICVMRILQCVPYLFHACTVSRHSSVGIATRYGLDGPGDRIPVESKFSAPVRTSPEAHPASYTLVTTSFPGVKWPGRGVEHLPHLAPRLKKE
jgi:hypothetical protein